MCKSTDCIRNIIQLSYESGHCVSEEAALDLLKQINEHLVQIDQDLLFVADVLSEKTVI